MRILRLRIANYRGVAEASLEPSPCGVTIVEGPNESGKSSFAEALDLVFEELDTSTKARVRAVRPAHRDAGAEIEVHFEAGPYEAVYFKRFHKAHETRLELRRPRREALVGREAHSRVEEILAETLDRTLWAALRFQQGAAIGQPDLAGQISLSRALDSAAGAVPAGEAELALFDAACAEFQRYFTEGGKPRGDLKVAEEELAKAHQEASAAEAALAALEALVARGEEADRRVEQLRAARDRLAAQTREHAARWSALEPRRRELQTLDQRVEAAEAARNLAQRDLGDRARLREDLEQAERRRGESTAASADVQAAFVAAEREFEAARDAEARARAALEAARADRDAARRDFEDVRDRHDLQLLRERRAKIGTAIERRAEAERALAGLRIDEAALQQIERADRGLRDAEARLRAEHPTIVVEALAEATLRIDGAERRLRAGERGEVEARARTQIELPGIVRIDVRSTASEEERDKARAALGALLDAAGARDVEAARRALQEKRDAERVAKEADGAIREALRDLTLESMDAKIRGLELRVEAYAKDRPAGLPRIDDVGEARMRQEALDASVRSAEEAFRAAGDRLAVARARFDQAREEKTRSTLLVDEAVARVAAAAGALRAARARAPDAEIELRLAKAEAEARAAAEARARAKAAFDAENPEAAELLLRNSERALARAEADLRGAEDERLKVRTELEVQGAHGLFERAEEAKRRRAAAASRLQRVRAHATAARTLYEVLAECRAEAHRNYVAPLKRRIDELGRVVFGPDFDVELDEELKVKERTLGGIRLPVESLSVGAQEQIAVLTRVACALAVAADGGVPVILDDSLGYSDPERLERMGAVLALAGRECQVIVLTCAPDRYRHVGDARIVRV
jgi:DNA repair exonuclease SbcCD ATPase subunit